MKRKVLFIFMALITPVMMAQQVTVVGNVFDAFQQRAVPDCSVTLTEDSTEVVVSQGKTTVVTETMEDHGNITTYQNYQRGARFAMKVQLSPSVSSYLLTIEKEGYEPLYNIISKQDLEKKKTLDLGDLYLIQAEKNVQMDEFVVKATKIKMFYKGDTIVYNADAFNVSQLDKLKVLVAQLPGVDFRDGVLSVNGRRIDNVTLSGKDFFNGNIDFALDNLPAYIVSKMKVYEKQGEMSELMGRDMHDQSYVMDIKLKREYIGTWMAKIEADRGTNELWGTQGMLMRYDERQMLTATFDANNMNQKRVMDEMANMADLFPSGRRKSISGKVNYYFEPNQTWRLRMWGEAEKTSHNTVQSSHTQTFLQPQNLNNRALNTVDNKLLSMNAIAILRYRMKKSQHELSYEYRFKDNDVLTDAMSLSWYANEDTASWNELPLDSLYRLANTSAQTQMLSSLLNPTQSKSTENIHTVTLASAFNLGNNLLKTTLSYENSNENGTTFQNYALTYYADSLKDRRRLYLKNNSNAQRASLKTEYEWKYVENGSENGGMRHYLSYTYDEGDTKHPLYRLERDSQFDLSDWTVNSLGILPEGDFKSACIDLANSYYSTITRHRTVAGLQVYYKHTGEDKEVFDVTGNIELSYAHNGMDYNRNNVPYVVKKHGLLVKPQVTLKWEEGTYEEQRWRSSLQVNYGGASQLPDLLNLLPIRDNSDTLNIFVGNGNLKNSFTHDIQFRYGATQRKTKHTFTFRAEWRHTQNDFAVVSDFNSRTGQRIYTPQNTNGTHSVRVTTDYALPIGAGQRTWLTAGVSSNYYQGDILSRMDGIETESNGLLHSLTITPLIKLSSTFGEKFRGSISYNCAFQRVEQPTQNKKYTTSKLACEFNWKLPWELELASTLNTFVYDGFDDKSLNQPISLWNASLSKYLPLSTGTLVVRMQANDLLGQANNVQISIDNFSRTEVFTNTLPRYVLVSLIYIIDWSSKRKNNAT